MPTTFDKIASQPIVEGDIVTLKATFTQLDGTTLVDPVEVTLTIREPGRPEPAPIVKTKSGGDLTNPSTGIYTYAHRVVAGETDYDFFGDSAASSSAKRTKGRILAERAGS